ncbi:MAG TPA: transglutaminase domain-containing protein [Acidimicrobiales bacterium]|nr:transglutaminase domain-containing protein [Acidimicrobiales bacterium]
MTDTLEPAAPVETIAAPSLLAGDDRSGAPGAAPEAPAPSTGPAPAPEEEQATTAAVRFRPLLVAMLASAATALTVGGIFGSWGARLFGTVAALIGVAWAWLSLRYPARRTVLSFGMLPVAVVLGFLTLVVGAGSSSGGFMSQISAAVHSGRLLRPPVPFDAGWRPLLLMILMFVGFASAWVGAALDRPQTALVIPLPLLLLAAISQPSDQQLLAGLLAFVPLVAALAVLFGGDGRSASQLTRQFELRRAVRGLALLAPAVVFLILLNQTSFLFPKPIYNPQSKPQKPKAVSLATVPDTDLFEVKAPITGPWKTGDLDVYDGSNWLLPPYQTKDVKPVPASGEVRSTSGPTVTVSLTTRDLGTTPVLPGVVGPVSISAPGQNLLYDGRTGTFRMAVGRVPANFTYQVTLPKYPTPDQLRGAGSLPRGFDKADYLHVPSPPPAVKTLLSEAPLNPFDRMSYLLARLSQVEIAVGGGSPSPVTPSKVQRILAGNHQGSPFELVATEALLARWAGVPSRIGFGFDGVEPVNGVNTVRPKDAAQWLEVYFPGHGWLPIVTTPPRAQASLNNDKNVKYNPAIQPGANVAVNIFVPVKIRDLKALYQQVRTVLLQILPLILLLVALYLALPSAWRLGRRLRRRRWAAARSPEAEVLAEYCEMRDAATDLGVGDPYATPIEFLDHVAEDDEHGELAWLVTRALYGDMAGATTPDDVEVARRYSRSLRRRLAAAQPLQSRVLAALSRASLREPYDDELPGPPAYWRRRPKAPAPARQGGTQRRRRRGATRVVLRRLSRTGRGAE